MTAKADISQVLSSSKSLPAVPYPTEDLQSLHAAVLALKEGYEILARQRGNTADSAVLVSDIEQILGKGV